MAVNSTPNLIIACTCNLLLMGLVLFQSAIAQTSTPSANVPPHITAIDDFRLLQLDESYTLPVKIRDDNGDDIKISIALGDESVVSTTPTVLDISENTTTENTLYFQLTPLGLGKTSVTLSASDGTSTSTETFEITVVANIAPTIDGIETQQTVSIFVGAPLVLRFRVNDPNVGSEKNENIQVTVMKNSGRIPTALYENPSGVYFLVLSTTNATETGQVTISISDAGGGMTKSIVDFNLLPRPSFIRSRFTVRGQLFGCSQCDPLSDGIVHIRFAPDAPIRSHDGVKDFIRFTVQLRRINGSDTPRYLTVASTQFNYDGSVLRCTNENTPVDLFAGKDYRVEARQIGNDIFSYGWINSTGLEISNPDLVSTLGSNWEDFVVMKCEITGNQTNEAGIAIYNSGSFPSRINEYISPNISIAKTVFVFVDNDLRGFRLDGKTYARDYARYGDGRGVRVEFSKGIATQLTNRHFDVHFVNSDTEVPDVERVIHTSGSRYADILISRPVQRAVIRLVSTRTSIVEDIEGNSLADGNFVAALEYDTAAPRATTITKVSFADGVSTWNIGFNEPIATNTVHAENLCITNEDGICADPGLATTPSIIATSLVGNTTMSVVITEIGSKRGATHSLEFRRNAILGEDFRIVEDYQKVLRDAVTIEDRFKLECGGFYPSIGQTELFFKITRDSVNPQGLTLMQNENLLDAEIEQIGNTVREVSIFKATFSNEISNGADIEAVYTAQDDIDTTTCIAELYKDSDGDGLADIVDEAPFDASVRMVNTEVASTAPLAEPPVETDVFYSRDVLIRSLFRGTEFDYVEVESNRPVKRTFTSNSAMTAAVYFGINNPNARVFRVNEQCETVLDAARDMNLTKVKINEYCLDVGDNFGSEPVGMRRYIWAVVENGYLVASNYRSYELNVAAEINFWGQSSYLYDRATTSKVIISTDIDEVTDIQIQVNHLSDTGIDELQTLLLTLTNGGSELETQANYALADQTIGHPSIGETVTHWLAGSSQVWQPTSDILIPKRGGYPEFNDIDYAIGSDNAVDIKLVQAGETITRINRIMLYDVADPTLPRVSSMVSGRMYYLIADLMTNISDIASQVSLSSYLIDGYTITTPSEILIDRIGSDGHFDNTEYFPVIALEVDDTSTTRTISVGWNRLGDLSDIQAICVVTPNLPERYAEADGDGDIIPDSLDLRPADATELQVAIGTEVGGINRLRTNTEKPLFVSDIGLIRAIGEGGDDSVDYSPANIVYDNLNLGTKTLLGFDDIDTAMQSLTTFGVSDVDYAIGNEGELVGGVAYTVFPMESSTASEILYLGTYNKNARRWERFDQDAIAGYIDTWYAIEHPNDGSDCPIDVQRYRNEYRSGGMHGMGFAASTRNCIMLIISDGGPYDDSSRDGRIVALNGISSMPFSFDRVFPPRPIIRVVAENSGRAMINTHDASGVTYSMRYEVFVGGTAQGLNDPSSYSLLRIRDDGTSDVITAIASVMPVSGRPNTVIVSYDEVRLNEAELRETSGFTLARNGTGLSGTDSIEPIRYSSGEVIAPGMRLDLSPSAIANTTPFIDEIDDFKLIPLNEAYPLAVTITDNIGDVLSVSIEADNTELMSTTPAFIEIASGGKTTNTVVFGLTPIAVGKVVLTVLASDGTTTDTQTFTVEIIENVPPVIEGIETGSIDLYLEASYVFNFRVRDMNLGVARNEELNAPTLIDSEGRSNFIYLEENLNDGYSLIITILFENNNVTISVTDNAGARAEVVLSLNLKQTDFIRSRFSGPLPNIRFNGEEAEGAACLFCDPTEDGFSRVRFAPDSVRLLNENGESFIEFSVEGKHSEPNKPYHILLAGSILKYNADAFGENLNNPFLTIPGSNASVLGDQCTYRSGLPDIFKDNGYGVFYRSLSNDVLAIAQISKHFVLDSNEPQSVAMELLTTIGSDWKKLFTIKCKVVEGQTNKEAGFAIHTDSTLRVIDFTRSRIIGGRILLPLVDNDILGFRLDGKTYVRDYARYGDGRGVRVEFSKGISTQLTTQHFVVRFADDSTNAPDVSQVIHTSGSPYANILIDEPVEGAVMRLVSTGTTVIEDIEGGSLADGSFVAALEYDASAPHATTITRVSLVDGISTWDIGFSAPIRAATVRAENLCITNDDNVCAMLKPTTPSAIVSASLSSATTMTVVVNEVDIATESGRSLEFRRNTVLGEDFRVVEDYQEPLRNQVAIRDSIPPTIMVVAGNHGRAMIVEERSTYITYDFNFMIYASEPVVGLTDPNSYQLLRVPSNGILVPIVAVPQVTLILNHPNAVMLSYTDIRLEKAVARESRGFTLGRVNSRVINDLSGNNPVGLSDSSDNTEPLDIAGVRSESAVAVIRASIYLIDLKVSLGELVPNFSSATTFYRVAVSNETTSIKVIPTSGDNDTITISLLTGDGRTVYQANTDIPLNQLGEQGNIIEVVVESESGVDSNTYTIQVIRAFSGNADLSNIVISKAGTPVSLTPAFNVETTTYTASVSNDTRELRATAIASDEMRAGIQISVDDGEFETVSTKNIDIQTGHKTTRGFETAVAIKVTADDGETSKSYTVTLIRSFDVADATLHDLEVSPGQLQPEYTTATFSYTVNVAATTATIRVIPTTNNNGTATISLVTENSRTVYQANADIPLNQLGEQGNIIQVAVVSGDGEHSNIYRIKVIRAFSKNADLSDIVISKADNPVSLTPAFNVETTTYTASVSNDTRELQVTAIASDEMRAGIQISIDDGEFETVSTKNIDIQTGHKTTRGFETAVAIKVTADDGETSKSYTVILIRSFDVAGSTLQNLEVSPGQLQPGYTTATFSYTVNVAATTATIKVIPTINDNSTATITLVTEDSRTVYQANTDIPLNQLGEQGNIIQVAVVSGDGEHSNIYTIKVIRAFSRNADLSDIVISKADDPVSLTPAFNVETTTYTASVSNDTRELQVTAIASDEMRAGIQISIDDGEFETVSTKNIDIQTGHKTTRGFETAVAIKVTADDGETSKSYTVILIRSFDVAGSTLQNLEVSPGQLQPEYTTATFVYTVNVAATTATIRVIPTINDNSTATITLVTEDSRTVYQANTDIPLNQLGEQGNIIQVAVVSGDGEHSNIYTIKVIRPFSRNADLSDIVISKGDDPVSLTPAFNVETTDYTASVSNDTRELRVTAVASDEMRAGIQISVDDGEFEEVSTKNIDIQTGHKTMRGFETAVAIKVTADDGETSKSYTVILIRSFDVAGSTLQNLEVSPGQLQPEYTTATFSYTVNVAATTATIKVIPTINDNSTATITLVTEDSRTVYQANTDIPLNQLGEQGNIIQVAVVSGDGEHSNIYTIKVIRPFSRNADLSDIVISKADDPVSLTPAFNVETTTYTASVSNDTRELQVTAIASDEMRAGIQISIDDGEFETVSTKNIDIQTGHKTTRGFETAVTIKVTADDGETSKSYTVILIRSFDVAGSTLQNLEVSPGQLQPEYTTATFAYTVNVAATTATIRVIPTINDNSTATITLVTEDSRTVYQANTDIPLNQLGEQGNIIQVAVVSGDGEHSNIYTIKVIRPFSRNADLSDIVISKADDPVSLTPAFNVEITDYTASVSNDTQELRVTAVASDEMRAGIQISIDDGEFETVSTKNIDIHTGHKTTRGFETAVAIKVTADDGETSKSYTVILIRSFDVAGSTLQNLEVSPGQLQPEYTTATFAYTVNVAATTATIKVIPTINDNSTATITLVTEDSRTVYQANTDIPLNQLGEQGNIIEVAVVSGDGEHSNIYTIKVIRPFNRNADLSDIVISKADDPVSLTPAFNVETTAYTASVSNDTRELRVTAVASDEMRADIQISIDDGEFEEISTKNIDIQAGHKTMRGFETAVAIKVTADDGETSKSYTVILIRSFDVAGSTLQNLEVSPGQLQPEYTTATFSYTVNVAATTATIKVIPTINDNSTATITLVTEDSRTVYQANADIPLNELGEQGNIIQVAVVSGDGEHSNIYTIKVIRAFSRNADLSDIVISKADDPVSLTPTFNVETTDYTASVSNDTQELRVTAVASDEMRAGIQISIDDGEFETVSTKNIDIQTGHKTTRGFETAVAIKVTADDGETSKSYTVILIRSFDVAGSTLQNLEVSPGQLQPEYTTATFAYTVNVAATTATIRVIPTINDNSTATITLVTEDSRTVYQANTDIPLNQLGEQGNIIQVAVVSGDGEHSNIYTIKVIRPFNRNADLSDIVISKADDPVSLTPAFNVETTTYTASVSNDTQELRVTAVASDEMRAGIQISIDDGEFETVSTKNIDIQTGHKTTRGFETAVAIKVTADDGETSKSYTLILIRAFSRNADLSDIVISKADDPVSLTPAFNVETTDYTASVSNDTQELRVTTVASDEMRAGIQISIDDGEFETVSTKNVDIQAGHKTMRGFETAVAIKVTADDGETSKSYTVILIRSFDVAGSTLQNLEVSPGQLQPEYTTATFVYTVNVAATTATIRVIPTINDNSTATITLVTKDSRSVYQANTDIPLNQLGEQGNIIQVAVVSGDGEHSNIYTIKVIRPFSRNADLSDIVISKGDDPVSLTPTFNVETTTYTASVSNDTRELQVTAIASDEMRAGIQISIDDGEFETVSTKNIDIQTGHKTTRGFETAVAIKVTADDGETSKSYTVILIRSFDVAGSTLQNLEVSPGQLQPEYTTATFAYTVNVAATTATIRVIPTINDNSTATITLVTEDSRTVYQANTDIPLNQLGEQGNIIQVAVVSGDGEHSNIYRIKVIRAFSRNADLSDIVISKADDPVSLTPAFNVETTTYTASVSNDTQELRVTAVASDEMRAGIQISIDDGEFEEISTKNIDIQTGHKTTRGFETAVAIKVTADDGETSKSYTVILIRSFDVAGSTLQNLEVSPGQLQPEYTTATFSYTVNVAATTATIRVIPTINDNSTATITLVTEDSRTVYQANTDIPLNQLGEQGNIIEVTVVPRDGEQSDIYIIRVIRPSSGIRVRAKVFLEGPLQ